MNSLTKEEQMRIKELSNKSEENLTIEGGSVRASQPSEEGCP